jgi:hypothetical protein
LTTQCSPRAGWPRVGSSSSPANQLVFLDASRAELEQIFVLADPRLRPEC